VELATGKENGQWIVYCLYFIDMLLSFNITVHMVFDGANLPAKRRTEGLRAASRTEALKTALDLSKSMDFKERSLAHSYFSKAVDVTPRMAAQLIRILRKTRPKVLCTVAPYEADAQLGFLCKEGLVDAIISEDSDTIPYGCKEVLFKLKHDGTCETVVLEEVYGTFLPGLDLRAFTPLMTVALCVGAGCDYLEPLKVWTPFFGWVYVFNVGHMERRYFNLLTGRNFYLTMHHHHHQGFWDKK
jgi:exonuclease-1